MLKNVWFERAWGRYILRKKHLLEALHRAVDESGLQPSQHINVYQTRNMLGGVTTFGASTRVCSEAIEASNIISVKNYVNHSNVCRVCLEKVKLSGASIVGVVVI